MINASLVEAALPHCIKDIALHEEVFERSVMRGLTDSTGCGPDRVRSRQWARPAPDSGVDDGCQLARRADQLTLEKHLRGNKEGERSSGRVGPRVNSPHRD